MFSRTASITGVVILIVVALAGVFIWIFGYQVAPEEVVSTATTPEPEMAQEPVPPALTPGEQALADLHKKYTFVEPGDNLSRISRALYYRMGFNFPEELSVKLFGENILYNMFVAREGLLSPPQRARYDALHIIPWNPKTGDDCSVHPGYELPPGATMCVPIFERDEPHPYALLSVEDLRAMPGDPVAVYHLARHKNLQRTREDTFELIVKASALADKSGELLQFAWWQSPEATDPARLEARRLRYVIERVTDAMGDERSEPDAREAEFFESLSLAGVDNPDEHIELAKAEANALLHDMDRTRREVLGIGLTFELKE